MSCPRCGSPDWKIASQVHREGLSNISTESNSHGVGLSGAGIGVGLGQSSTQGTSQTALSYSARPPEDPRAGKFSVLYLVFLGVVMFFAVYELDFLVGVVLVVAAAIVPLFLIDSLVRLIPAPDYEAKLKRWNETRVCTRCGQFYFDTQA
jgi:hypothetical protein